MVRLLDDGVQRATGLVDSILEYATAAEDGASRTEVDCSEVVSEVLATLASQIEHVDGRVEVGELPTLQASRPGWSGSFRTSSPTRSSFTTAIHRTSLCPRKTARPPGPSRYATTGSDCPRTARSSRCSRAAGAITRAAGSASQPAGGSSRPTAGASGRSPRLEAAAPFTSRCREQLDVRLPDRRDARAVCREPRHTSGDAGERAPPST